MIWAFCESAGFSPMAALPRLPASGDSQCPLSIRLPLGIVSSDICGGGAGIGPVTLVLDRAIRQDPFKFTHSLVGDHGVAQLQRLKLPQSPEVAKPASVTLVPHNHKRWSLVRPLR